MLTLFLRYTIDPNKLDDFLEYVKLEQQAITESGGKIVGYYIPTDYAGNTNEGYGLIDVAMDDYDTYRKTLADHPLHKENAARLERSGALVSIYRAFIQRVPPSAS
jgi:hypothetical protein